MGGAREKKKGGGEGWGGLRGFGNGGGARCQRGKEKGGGFGYGAGARPGGRGFKGGAEKRKEGRVNGGACSFVRECARTRIDLPHFCVETLARAHVCVCA